MSTVTETVSDIKQKLNNGASFQHREPLQLKGVLDQYRSFDVTPTIGREFPEAQLTDWLESPDADDVIRDLAITGTLHQQPSELCRNLTLVSLSTWSRLLS